MLFAEPAHPYDDPDQPPQWAWRYGYFELLYTPGIQTLSLSRGPKYSIRGPKHSCRRCHGSGYLPRPVTPDRAADTAVPCPTCPAYRVLFEDLTVWPLRFLDQLRHRRFGVRRRSADHPAQPGPGRGAPPARVMSRPGPARTARAGPGRVDVTPLPCAAPRSGRLLAALARRPANVPPRHGAVSPGSRVGGTNDDHRHGPAPADPHHR